MENDFQQHLDVARVWWDLDDSVLQAIADGPSTRDHFRDIALYVLDQKKRHLGADPSQALAKIAIRVAGSPQLEAGIGLRMRPTQRLSVGRRLAVVSLLLVAALALLTAAAAAEWLPLPTPIRAVLDRIGIPTETDPPNPRGSSHRDVIHQAGPPTVDASSLPTAKEAPDSGTLQTADESAPTAPDSREGRADATKEIDRKGFRGGETIPQYGAVADKNGKSDGSKVDEHTATPTDRSRKSENQGGSGRGADEDQNQDEDEPGNSDGRGRP
jgi:hypothetical protein